MSNAKRDREVVEAVNSTLLPSMLEGVVVGDEIVSVDDPRMCIGATRIALDLLKRYYIFGRALKVHVLVYNRQAWAWQEAHPEQSMVEVLSGIIKSLGKDREIEDPAFVQAMADIGADPKSRVRFCGSGSGDQFSMGHQDRGFLNGHVIGVVDVGDDKILIDPSAQQFTTPEWRLLIPPLTLDLADDEGRAWLEDPTGWWLASQPEDLGGTTILYRQPEDLDGVFNASDWKDLPTGKRYEQMLDALQEKAEEVLKLVRL
jgi:hypothetical protein